MTDYAVVASCEQEGEAQPMRHDHHHYILFFLSVVLFILTVIIIVLLPLSLPRPSAAVCPVAGEEAVVIPSHTPPPRPTCDATVSVLITGITGLIGSHVAHSLLATKPCYTVYGLVRSRSDLSNLIGMLPYLHLVEGDITDPYRMTQLVGQIRPQYVYHFAAQAINSVSYDQPESTTLVNVQGTLHLLEAIKQSNLTACRFFFAGSSTEYGHTADVWEGVALPETAPLDPVSPYGASKVAAEALVRQYWLSAPHIPQIIVGRFFIHIGVGGTASLAIQQFAQQIAMAELGYAEPVLYHGDLSTSRDITDIQDSAPLVIQVMETGFPGEAYNIGSGVLTSMQSLLSKIIHLSRVEIETRVDTTRYRAYDEKSLVADVSKLGALTGQLPHFHATGSVWRILHHWRQKVARLYDTAAVTKQQPPLLVPLDSCPFGNIDLFIVVVERDFPILAHLLLSLDLFMSCYGYLHIITDTLQDELKLRTWMRIHERVIFHRMNPPDNLKHVIGYILQAWKANWVDTLAQPSADYAMIMDTDVLFTLPVTCRSLFDERGRPYLGSWSIKSQGQFVAPCEEMIGTGNCTRSYMAFFPILLDLRIFAPARQHAIARLEQAYNTSFHGSFDDAFAMWTHRTRDYKTYSQYVNLGSYNYHHQHDLAHFIHYPHVKELQPNTDEAAWYIPPAIHYGWRYCQYLDSCVSNPGNPGTSFPGYTGKYGDKTIQMMQALLHEGNCLKEALAGKPPPPGCTPEMATTVHVDARAYQGLEPNLSYIQRIYRPDTIPSQCAFLPPYNP